MSITVNLYYTGEGGNARKFAGEMVDKGIVAAVRAEEGNKRTGGRTTEALFSYILV